MEIPQRLVQSDPTSAAWSGASSKEFNLTELLRSVRAEFWRIILLFIVAVAMAVYYGFFVATAKFAATALIVMEGESQQVIDLESVISGSSTDQAAFNTELEKIRSRRLLKKLVDQLNLVEDPEFNPTIEGVSIYSIDGLRTWIVEAIAGEATEAPTAEQIERLVIDEVSAALSVSVRRDSYIFNIRFVTEGRRKSMQMANALSQIYLDSQLESKFQATSYAIEWLSQKASELEEELKTGENELRTLQNSSQLVSLEALEALRARSKGLRERVENQRIDVSELERLAEMAAALLAEGDIAKLAVLLDENSLNLLISAEAANAGNNQGVILAEASRLVSQRQADAERAATQLKFMIPALVELERDVEQQTLDLEDLYKLQREIETTRILHNTFLARLKEASIQIGLTRPDGEVLAQAELGRQVQPRKARLMFLAGLLGIFAGGLWAYHTYRRDNKVTNIEDIEAAVGLSAVGRIPKVPRLTRKGLINFITDNPTSALVESVRNLRTSLSSMKAGQSSEVIMVTSSVPGEGKTTLSISLAFSYGNLGKRVLLIGADVRRLTLTEYFPDLKVNGLAEVTQEGASLSDHVITQEIGKFDIITGVKTDINPADFFASNEFASFLRSAKEEYDAVIIDTPPVHAAPDSRIISVQCDTCLYVVRELAASKDSIINGIRELRSMGSNKIGLTFVNSSRKTSMGYGYGYGYGYGRYDSPS